MTCRQLTKELARYEWTIGELTGLCAEDLWTRENTDNMGYEGHDYLARDKYVNFERGLWFEFGRLMWRKKWSV